MMCRCEPLRSSGYGHMADGFGAEQAVHRTACSADFHGSAVAVEELTSVTRSGCWVTRVQDPARGHGQAVAEVAACALIP